MYWNTSFFVLRYVHVTNEYIYNAFLKHDFDCCVSS